MNKPLTEYDSVWEWSKTKSSYHFDNYKQDRPNSTFMVCGQIPVTWADYIPLIRERSFPTTWNNITSTGGSKQVVLGIDKRRADIAKGGGDLDNIEMTDVFDDFREFPELQKIIDSFSFSQYHARCHVQKTGQMFTAHIDPIQRLFYKDGNGNPDNQDYGYDPLDIVRATVMLEDWQPGQFMIYGNSVYQQWRAGEVHMHDWPNVPHATANASEHTRITLQVTGLRTELTNPRFNVRHFK
jgi:enamine deaminase RidA (YjgF/YER057c/UK114 family)